MPGLEYVCAMSCGFTRLTVVQNGVPAGRASSHARKAATVCASPCSASSPTATSFERPGLNPYVAHVLAVTFERCHLPNQRRS